MGRAMTILELKAQHDALQKIATTRDPVRALAEFVWNALDADATEVAVELNRNALGGIDAIRIRDKPLKRKADKQRRK
jgi:Histidine kinase-, DNA gyrase B-, and HSP90-like ATPase